MAPYLLARSDFTNGTTNVPDNKTAYIIGFTLSGLLVTVAISWIASRFFRKRLQEKRAEGRGAAFLNVRGVMQEMKEPVNNTLSTQTTQSVVFPKRALIHRPSPIAVPSRHDGVPSAVHSSPSPHLRVPSNLNPAHPRHSSSGYSNSFASSPRSPPGLCSPCSSRSSSSFQARRVRQIFQPVLPDELTLSRLGEHLHVVQSFDDGWCLAARDNHHGSRSSLSIFSSSRLSTKIEGSAENVALGFVPAWVFIKPMKGLRVERPIRSSSADVLSSGPSALDSRKCVISWSHFT